MEADNTEIESPGERDDNQMETNNVEAERPAQAASQHPGQQVAGQEAINRVKTRIGPGPVCPIGNIK